jgi:capsular polysaccharide export protein
MKVLIQCGDHFENQNRVFLLAKEIYMLGHEPVILMYKPNKGNIFKNTGISVIALNDYFSSNDHSVVNFDTVLYKNIKVKDFLEVEGKRRPEITWPSQQAKIAASLKRHVDAVCRVLLEVNPDQIVIWNGFTGYVANALRKICDIDQRPCAFLERGLFKDSIFIDHQGVNGAASISQVDPSVFEPVNEPSEDFYFLDRCFNLTQSDIAKHENMHDEFLSKRIVFFPLQVQLDTNIVLYSPYKTMRHAFFKIYEALNDGNTLFVLRPHPEENPDQKLNIPKFENVLVSTEQSLEYWIDRCDVVVTINSTVGLEALIKHKPVVCLGGSIYSAFPYLVSLQQLTVDAHLSRQMLMGYLAYLMKNNILKSDSPWRASLVTTQLKLPVTPSIQRLLPIDQIKNDVAAWLKTRDTILDVYLAFSFDSRLNLTYRKHDEAMNKPWIDTLLHQWLGVQDYRMRDEALDLPIDIMIVDEDQVFKQDQAMVIIDTYGNLMSFNGRLLV